MQFLPGAGTVLLVKLNLVSLGLIMKNVNRNLLSGYFGVVMLLACGLALAAEAPANVTGAWNVTVSGAAGNAEQTLNLKQEDNKITGTFKGPRQSGPLEGTVEGNNIAFHVATRVPIDYTGIIEDADTMKGTLTGNGKTGDWVAKRAK